MPMSLISKFASALALVSVSAFAAAPQPQPRTVTRAAASEPFVLAANPLATQAGLNVLKRCGSAVDAAIAVPAMLSLLAPQGPRVGAPAFMTYTSGRTSKT